MQNNKNFKILLVVPRYSDMLDFNNRLEDKCYNYTFPIGLGYISAVMKKSGYGVDVLNLNHTKGTLSEVLNRWMNRKRYDIVATGHIGMGFSIVQKICQAVRYHPSKPKIILGGALITSEKDLMFRVLKPDYAVCGEGEITIIELLKCIQKNGDFSKVDGIMFRDKNNKLITTSPRAPIKNIDTIPFPDFDGLGFKEYLDNQFTNTAYYQNSYDNPRPLAVLASRSCPFRCTFCYHSIGTGYRERSIKNLMQEVKLMIKKYDINILCINDDLFSARRERLLDFCNQINKINKNRQQKIKWTCQLSVKTVDDELLRIMKDAGCETISYGFESFSEDVLKSMNKPITPQQIDYALKATIKARIGVQANFIFGDPAETLETSRKTLEYWKKACMGQVNIGFIQPYPGSAIYDLCLSKGIIKDKLNYIKNEMTTDAIFNMTEKMSDEQIDTLAAEIQTLKSKHYNFVVPDYTKKIGKGYELKVKCPFCKNKIVYGNCFLQNRLFYATYGLVCRCCNMRFNVISPLVNLMKNFHLLSLVEKTYYKVKKLRSVKVK